MSAKRKARVQTSMIRNEQRHLNAHPGRFNPVSMYGSLTITDSVVRAGSVKPSSFAMSHVYYFPRWDFLKRRAEAYS